jgi:hypothetical protein
MRPAALHGAGGGFDRSVVSEFFTHVSFSGSDHVGGTTVFT